MSKNYGFKILIICLFMHLFFQAKSQQNGGLTIYTCAGNPITAFTRAELSSAEYAAAEVMYQWELLTYNLLGTSKIANSTGTYNCHGYAWHMSVNNPNQPVWLANISEIDPTVDVNGCYQDLGKVEAYFNDGCYIQVCNESEADKVHYWCGDHSATRSLSNPGLWESKWGQGPLVLHPLTSVPPEYKSNQVHFYANPKIDGITDNWCFDSESRTFSVKNITGATYSWSFSSNIQSLTATNTNQITLKPNFSVSTGSAFIQVTITSPCSTTPVTKRIDFNVGYPIVNGAFTNYNGAYIALTPYDRNNTINNEICYADVVTTDMLVTGSNNITWQAVTTTDPYLGWYTAAPNLVLWFSNIDYTARFRIIASNGSCETVKTYQFKSMICYLGMRLAISPNPSTGGSISVDLKETKEKIESSKDIVAIKIVDKVGQLIKEFKFEKGSKKPTINISSLKKDIYVIRVFDGTTWTASQIIVQ